MRNPVGPEEPSVYWRRRAIVGVGLLVALLLLWWLFSAVFGSDEPDDQQPPPTSPTSAPATAGSPAGSPSPTATASAKAAAQATEGPTPDETGSATEKKAKDLDEVEGRAAAKKPQRCRDSDVSVAVRPAQRAGEVGAGMKVTLVITNQGATTCRRDLGDANNEIRVVSGRVLVWSSNSCPGVADGESAKAGVVTLKPEQAWSTTVRWPGKVTSLRCPPEPPTAKPGTYRAIGANGDVRSAESRFTLR